MGGKSETEIEFDVVCVLMGVVEGHSECSKEGVLGFVRRISDSDEVVIFQF